MSDAVRRSPERVDVTDDMRIEIGPVDVGAARCWLAHVLRNLAVVRRNRQLLPFRLPDEVADDLDLLLSSLLEHAEGTDGDEFRWGGLLAADRVRLLVHYWANLDSLSDDQVRALGVDWSPPAGRPFFVALTEAIAVALAADDRGANPFAELLVDHGRRPVRSVRTA